MAPLGQGKCDVSSFQATGVQSIKNCVVLGEYCGGTSVATRAVGVLNGTFSSNN